MVVHEVSTELPHEYYPAIGRFLFHFGQLEYLLHEIVWRCLDISNPQGRTLTIGTDLSVLIATLNTATSDRSPWVSSADIKGEVGNIIKVAKDYRALRNQLSHGSWQSPQEDSSDVWMHYMKETSDQRILPTARRITVAQLHNASGKVKAATERAKRLISKALARRPEPENRPPV